MTAQAATTPLVKHLTFSAEIVPQTVQALIQVISKYQTAGVQEVYFTLTTAGGETRAGVHLYNFLRGMPFRLTVHNIGYVDSIGTIVFLAGDRRYANPHATFMFHGVGIRLPQAQSLDEPLLRDKLKIILRDQERLGSIIQERTNLDGKAVAALFRKAQTKDAAWAADHAFIDETKEFKVPPGTPIDSLTVQSKAT